MSEYQLSATLELKDRFTSKIKSASSALKNFENTHTNTGSVVRDTANCIQDSSKKIVNMAKAFGAVKVASATFGFLKSAYVGYAQLDHTLTKNKAIMGASALETSKLKISSNGAWTNYAFHRPRSSRGSKVSSDGRVQSQRNLRDDTKTLKTFFRIRRRSSKNF